MIDPRPQQADLLRRPPSPFFGITLSGSIAGHHFDDEALVALPGLDAGPGIAALEQALARLKGKPPLSFPFAWHFTQVASNSGLISFSKSTARAAAGGSFEASTPSAADDVIKAGRRRDRKLGWRMGGGDTRESFADLI